MVDELGSETEFLQVFHNLLAAIEAVHAVVFANVRLQLFFHGIHVQMGIRREDVDGLEVIFLTQHVVVHIVRRRHFEATGTETDLYIAVFDDRNHTTYTRNDDMLTLEPLVLLLLGVDADGDITEDGFRTGGSDDGVLTRLLRYFVAQVIELIMLVVVDDLLVG